MYIVSFLAEIVYLGFSSCVLAPARGCQLKDEDVGSLSNSPTPRNGKVIQYLPKIWVWLYVFVLRPAKMKDSVCKYVVHLADFRISLGTESMEMEKYLSKLAWKYDSLSFFLVSHKKVGREIERLLAVPV